MKSTIPCIVFLAACLLGGLPASAHPVEQQELGFGRFAMSDNNGQYTSVMPPGGGQSYHAKMHPFSQGQPAVFLLENYPISTELFPTIPDTTLNPVVPGGPSFDIINFTFSPSPSFTNGIGTLILNVGATLRTDGSGRLYDDGDYESTYTLTINY